MSTEHRLTFTFQARYRTLGKPDKGIKHMWLVCHGHGHLAEYFIKQFACLDDGRHLIVAPEGLSRYYLKGFTGRVGATWMTKEDRLNDINNYLAYLEAVHKEVKQQLSDDVKITLFGFSQGAATISRFATQTEVHFDRLILWAGIFPPDLPALESTERIKDKPVYWIYGKKDPYLSAHVMEEQGRIAENMRITPEVISFEGEHELNQEVLIKLSKESYRQK
ncbi:MAG: alpha/beta hydrolase [Roseivirga sp.]|nr:alpha/beta hydrolase [Roseivirga sp.]